MEEENTIIPTDDSNDGSAKLPVLRQLGLLAVLLLLIFGGAITAFLPTAETDDGSTDQLEVSSEVASVITQLSSNEAPAFTEISIAGKAAYVWDIQAQRTLYEKNEAQVLPLASLTKLMTALVAHEILEETDTITISEEAVRQDGVSRLRAGESFDRQDLSDLMLISSSNDGAYALAYAAGAVLSETDPANAFVQAMNIRAKEIGLSATFFKNPTGLDITLEEGGAYGTARDIAFLMEYIVRNEPVILAYTKDLEHNVRNTAGYPHEIENTNYYVDQIPGLIGSKTGFTDLAGGNLVVAFEAGLNRPVVIVVLGSTRQERFSDVITLINEVKQYLNQT